MNPSILASWTSQFFCVSDVLYVLLLLLLYFNRNSCKQTVYQWSGFTRFANKQRTLAWSLVSEILTEIMETRNTLKSTFKMSLRHEITPEFPLWKTCLKNNTFMKERTAYYIYIVICSYWNKCNLPPRSNSWHETISLLLKRERERERERERRKHFRL